MPVELKAGPFTIDEAREAGISWDQLQSNRWRRLGAGIYAWKGHRESPNLILAGIARRLPAAAAFSGATAAWLHGLDLPPCSPVEVTIPEDSGISARFGTRVRRAPLAADEITEKQGLPVTTGLRTAADLGSHPSLVEGVVGLDMALHEALVELPELERHASGLGGRKGGARLRRALELAEPATESAMESRLRLVLIRGRLPRPTVQVSLFDDDGEFIARPDLLYRDRRLAIEYDGGIHRDNLVGDNRRQNRLLKAGYRVLRFTAPDVYGNPDEVAMRVRHALAQGQPRRFGA